MTIAWIFLGFILLAIGGRFILRSAIAISLRFNISKVVIGMTVVAFATSLPELLISLKAAIIGSSSIAMNNVIGSNIANIGLVLGLTALIGNIGVPKSFYKTIWPLMFFLSLLLYWFIFNDNFLSRYEGLTLFICLVIFLIFSVKNTPNNIITKNEAFENLQYTSSIKIVIWILISSLSLYYGAEWLVFGAIALASSTGISEAVISVTVIAVGTSIPEIATSIIAIGKNQKGISIGNLIGSNIKNIRSN